MALVINHNLMAMNVARNLTDHYGALSTSTQRLSSGLRINSSADDAAGLAVRELMRSDIATMNQGIRNANDAISMIQTADGALQVIDEKLIRMKELAEQAATGTYTSVQRLIIDSEFQAMSSEIDRISKSTEFNGIKILDTAEYTHNITTTAETSGKSKTELSSNVMLNLAFNGDLQDSSGNNHAVTATNYSYTTGPEGGQAISFDGTTNDAQVDFGMTGDAFTIQFWVNANSLTKPISQLLTSNAPPGKRRYEIQATNNGNIEVWFSNDQFTNHIYSADNTITSGSWYLITNTYDNGAYTLYVNGNIAIQQTSGSGDTFFTSPMWIGLDPSFGEQLDGSIDSLRIYNKALTPESIADYYNASGDVESLPNDIYTTSKSITDGLKVHFGTGNDSAEDYYNINIYSTTISSLGLFGVNIRTQNNAQNALDKISTAMVKKDKIRANLGATQNRLENTISNLEIQAENLQAAESQISDTDIASEMTNYVREEILAQASVAMLSQANSMPKMALQLIEGS